MAAKKIWNERADEAFKQLNNIFWKEGGQTYHPFTPFYEEKIEAFHYWWQAHAIDVLLDNFERTENDACIDQINTLVEGVRRKTNEKLTNDFYDDMLWMALALLRAYDLTGDRQYLDLTKGLWDDILTGWNDHCGGGFAWQKDQLYYKNTPANAPAVILALRLYKAEHDKQYLEKAEETFAWLEEWLVDDESGFVWDGMNRRQDMKIDKSWEFTYCQGVYVGACVEYYQLTHDDSYLKKAEKTIGTAFKRLTHGDSGLLAGEGTGDGGLFKGIFVRYVDSFLQCSPNRAIAHLLIENGRQAWEQAYSSEKLFGENWASVNEASSVTLSTHLSGCMLMESIFRLQENTKVLADKQQM